MNAIQQFALYNLLPALVGGAIAWAAIGSAIYLLGVRHGKLRLCLLSVPLLKSTLLLLGVGLVLPWPRDVFGTWHAQALGPTRVFPFFLLFTGAAIAARTLLATRARRQALAGAAAAESSSPRLSKALDEVMQETHRRRQIIIDRCGFAPKLARPDLLVATSPLSSPLIVTDEAPRSFSRRISSTVSAIRSCAVRSPMSSRTSSCGHRFPAFPPLRCSLSRSPIRWRRSWPGSYIAKRRRPATTWRSPPPEIRKPTPACS